MTWVSAIVQRCLVVYRKLQSLPRVYHISIKCVLSIFLLWSVLRSISFDELRTTMGSIVVFPLIVALLLKYINMFIMTGKWLLVLPEPARFRSMVLLYWAADFMGLFAVGIVGTELFKGMVAQRKPQVVTSSLLDRGLAFILYATICATVALLLFLQPIGLQLLGIVASLSIYILLLLLIIRIAQLYTSWYGKQLTIIPLVLHALLSTVSIIITTFSQWAIFSSLGISTPWLLLLLFSVVLILALALPVTIQGIGIREWVYVTTAPLLSLSPEIALSAAWLHYLLDTVYKSSGALPYLTKHHRL